MSGLLLDLRFAIRNLRKAPGFAAIAIATLAIGIAATTIIFAVVDAVLIRPLPFEHSEQLVHLTEDFDRQGRPSIAYANFRDWESMNRVFVSMGAIRIHAVTLSGSGTAQQLDSRQVSHDFLRTLGVTLALGRDFNADDDVPSAVPTVILSDKLWRERFNADPTIIGRAVALDREPHTVIGVLPRSFSYADDIPDALIPIGLIKDPQFRNIRFAHEGTYAVARMKPGVTLEQARADMDRVAQTLQRLYPETNSRSWAALLPMREWMVGDVRKPLLILLSAVALLLLIACANVANLLLAKGSARTRELAIRLAVGASRARILRQLLTESVVLALFGGFVGLLLADWGTWSLVAASPDSLPRVAEIRLDPAVLAFSFGISVLTGILFGIAPALHAPAANAQLALREGERGGMSRGQQRVRSGLIVAQIAISLSLLFGAGLLMRSFQRIMQVDAGFNPHQLLTASIVMAPSKYKTVAESEQFYDELIRRIRAIPGVSVASGVEPMPMSGDEWDDDYIEAGMDPSKLKRMPNSEVGFVGPGYLATMQIPLVAGRGFTEQDNAQSLGVAIVNQAFVRKNWPGQNPLGKRIRFGDGKALAAPETPQSRWLTVVGVIGDVKQYGLDRRIVPTIYRPFSQLAQPVLQRALVVRSAVGDPLSLTSEIRAAIASVDPDEAMADVSTMDHRLSSRLATRQLSMMLLGLFATLALALGSVGIYGVVSFWVVQRTREIGIRMALGARGTQVLELILGRAAVLVAIGIGIGLALSVALSRALASMLFGVTAGDPLVIAIVVAVLATVTILASYVPARRATRVDPMIVLRYE